MTPIDPKNLITHTSGDQKLDVSGHIKRLKETPNLTLPLEVELDLLQQLTEFELGRYLLLNRGISGYWTAYWLIHGPAKNLTHPLEDWLINKVPGFISSRERFKIFADQTQKRLKNNMKLASVPCGLMDDLLRLDYSKFHNITLTGLDLDEESIDLARKNAKALGKESMSNFQQADAWDLGYEEEFDLITSNGLNIYEPDDNKAIALYKEFTKALKPGGILITSFVTPPPNVASNSPWKNFNFEDVIKQKAIFEDIIQVNFMSFRDEEKMRKHLGEAGLKVTNVIYDSQGIFPCIVAEK